MVKKEFKEHFDSMAKWPGCVGDPSVKCFRKKSTIFMSYSLMCQESSNSKDYFCKPPTYARALRSLRNAYSRLATCNIKVFTRLRFVPMNHSQEQQPAILGVRAMPCMATPSPKQSFTARNKGSAASTSCGAGLLAGTTVVCPTSHVDSGKARICL